jgi:hypothetical protein
VPKLKWFWATGIRYVSFDAALALEKTYMCWVTLIACFFGGAFITNGIPHIGNGLSGRAFQTPFAKPPGKGYSSATVNLLWGAANSVVGFFLLTRAAHFDPQDTAQCAAAIVGGLAIGLPLTRAFGAIHGGNSPPV